MAGTLSSQDQSSDEYLRNKLSSLTGKAPFPDLNSPGHAKSGKWEEEFRPAQTRKMGPLDRILGRHKFLGEHQPGPESVDVTPRKALLSGRLQSSTNRKRRFEQPDLQTRQKLQQYFNNQEPESPPRKRYSSEDPTAETCAQGRRGLPLGDKRQPAINNAGAMTPGKSQGTRQPPTQRTTTPESPALLSSDAKSKQDASIEILDSAEEDENEGKVVSAKRVKPEKILKQHRSEVYAADTTELEEQDLSHKAVAYAQDKGSAHDSHITSKRKNPLWQFWDRRSSAIPDYGNTGQEPVPAPSIVRDPRSMAPYKSGGPRPINTLAGKGNKNPESRAFNLTRLTESETAPARKRQKIERPSISSSESTKPAIEVESNSRLGNKTQRQPNAKSFQSPSQNDRRRSNGSIVGLGIEVGEYRQVREVTRQKPSRRPRVNSTSESVKGGSSLAQPSGKRSQMAQDSAELSDDPIQTEPGLLENDSRRFRNGKSHLEVQLKSGGYKGSANLRPGRIGPGQSSAVAPEVSPHFAPPTTSKQQRQNSRNASAVSKTGRDVTSPRGDDEGVDEISAAHYQDERSQEVANTLLTVHKLFKKNGNSTSPRVVIPQGQSHRGATVVQHSSDEEETLSRGNIPQTNFNNTKKTSMKRANSRASCEVTQLLTYGHNWLSGEGMGSIDHHSNEDNMMFYDVTGTEISQLMLAFSVIQRVIYSRDSPKIVIHKPGDAKIPGGHQIHVEFSDIRQSVIILNAISKKNKNARLFPKTSDHLDKIFGKLVRDLQENHEQSLREVPEDVSLARKRQQDRQEQKIESRKANGRRLVDRLQAGEEDYSPESITRSGKKRIRSSSELSDNELRHKFDNRQMPASEFYGNSDIRQSRATDYSTRSSVRNKGSSAHDYQKPRSASPERWTTTNPRWGENWHSSIIYPREGKNKATVDKEDIERLDEGAFLNDNLIEFYLRWLEARVTKQNPEFAKRIYFCNTFFYVRLTQDAKGKRGINYDAVARWTAKVDIFSYDYIIVPVNESLHWYLAIICNVPKFLDPEQNLESSSPSRGLVDNSQEQQVDANDLTSSPRGAPELFSTLEQPVEINEDPVVSTKMEGMSLEDEPTVPLANVNAKNSQDPEPENWPETDPQPLSRKKEQQSSASAADVVEERGPKTDDELDLIVSDLQATPVKKVVRGKKAHRKSLPTPRKYNLNEPRIITLDSFGNSHSPTCTNLRAYLIAEAKAKKNRDITPPGTIGMTAKHIPGQNNYCDCGLYLLSYVEMFLEKGDNFIHGLLQNSLDDNLKWRHGPEMRQHIRDLLFGIQKEQVAENDRIKREKGKAKRLSKAESRPKPAEKACQSSKEPTPEAPKNRPGNILKTSSEDVTGTKPTTQAKLEGVNSSHRRQQSGNDSHETIASYDGSTDLQPLGKVTGGLENVASAFWARHDPTEPKQDSKSKPGSTNKNAVEIPDSPAKSVRNVDQKAKLPKPTLKDEQPNELRGPFFRRDDNATSSTLHQSSSLAGFSPPGPASVIDLDEDSEQFVSAGETFSKDTSKTSRPLDDGEMLLTNGSQELSRGCTPDSPVMLGESPTTRLKASLGRQNSPSHRSHKIETSAARRHATKTPPPRPGNRDSKPRPLRHTSPMVRPREAAKTDGELSDMLPLSPKKRKPAGDSQDAQEESRRRISPKHSSYQRDASDLAVIGRHQGNSTSKSTGKHSRFT